MTDQNISLKEKGRRHGSSGRLFGLQSVYTLWVWKLKRRVSGRLSGKAELGSVCSFQKGGASCLWHERRIPLMTLEELVKKKERIS